MYVSFLSINTYIIFLSQAGLCLRTRELVVLAALQFNFIMTILIINWKTDKLIEIHNETFKLCKHFFFYFKWREKFWIEARMRLSKLVILHIIVIIHICICIYIYVSFFVHHIFSSKKINFSNKKCTVLNKKNISIYCRAQTQVRRFRYQSLMNIDYKKMTRIESMCVVNFHVKNAY